MVMSGGQRFVLGLAWGAVAVLAFAGSVHAQGGTENAAPRPQVVDEGEPGDTLRRFAGRLVVHVNGAYQLTAKRYERRRAFQAYGEQAEFISREEFTTGDHVDAGGALRIWRRLAVGASYTQVSRSGTAVVSGTVPHPIEAGRDRTVQAQTLALQHRQRATHVYAAWRFRFRDSWSVALSAGPTYFSLRQGGIANLTPSEAGGPLFSDVDLQVDTVEHTRNGVGFNAGADFTVMLPPLSSMPRLGVGYFVRLALGSIDIPSTTGARDTYHVGGVQTGVGLRFLF